jgi:hypothetical protein
MKRSVGTTLTYHFSPPTSEPDAPWPIAAVTRSRCFRPSRPTPPRACYRRASAANWVCSKPFSSIRHRRLRQHQRHRDRLWTQRAGGAAVADDALAVAEPRRRPDGAADRGGDQVSPAVADRTGLSLRPIRWPDRCTANRDRWPPVRTAASRRVSKALWPERDPSGTPLASRGQRV